ncbi:PucR family transcriptional regulator [Sinomonas gamaensis]|uniref:PucR family transcriptional regulator n=1 Tax=Sinomonas gamaensis TaxID=2565624 RepID=UPI00110811ED|nr:PucR family transcriptional regulator [Sinomonas gamaensis]
MPPTIRDVLGSSRLRLRLVVPEDRDAEAVGAEVGWVHSSDLADPTPFLDSGQLLLTDGSQFPLGWTDGSAEDAYVERLVARGICGLGFATQVIHGSVPGALVEACGRHGLPLIEVPDRTPFIAIIRFVADWIAREQHAQAEWSLQAQRAIARAALRPDGLRSILGEMERQLRCWVALFDAAGNYLRMPSTTPMPSGLVGDVTDAARAALNRGERSVVQKELEGQQVTLQTLGRRNRLRGVLALGGLESLDPARIDIVNSVIALASLALEQTRSLDTARQHLRAGVFEQLLSGRPEVAASTARQVWGRLPADPVVVALARPAAQGQNLLEALELLSDDHRGAVFYAPRETNVVVLSSPQQQQKVLEVLARYDAAAGLSNPTPYAALADGLGEAERALDRALELSRPVVEFSEIAGRGMLGLLRSEKAESVAQSVLQPLLRDDSAEARQLLEAVTVWLGSNCGWEKAAAELGVHRHTLRNRIDAAGRRLGLNLDTLHDRLELWAAVQFLDARNGPREA